LDGAIQRAKQLKKWNRAWKLALIEKMNPTWRDLWYEMVGDDADGNPCSVGSDAARHVAKT